MKIRLLKGCNQIGGAITEIRSKRARIIIDFGHDLDNVDRLPQIKGLTTGRPKYDGVIISHNHQDHMGRIDEVLHSIPVYFSDLSRQIFERVFCFSTIGKIKRKTTNIEGGKPFYIKDMKITPYVVDHSAYNSFMFLIEAEGRKALISGDFRSHGYTGGQLVDTLKTIGKVDVLITEGTTLSREQIRNKTEEELAQEIIAKTANYNQVLMLMSTTNIDRVQTMNHVGEQTNKTVIHDIILSNVLSLIPHIPSAINSDNIFVFLPRHQLYKKEYSRVSTIYKTIPR